ncbi:hypothetical protein SNL152K_7047 [Streptomyces sp. NL15-2K]|nr:hypothetical protein SNL152K_7047 [Streptomyces sp. NL15-2K]
MAVRRRRRVRRLAGGGPIAVAVRGLVEALGTARRAALPRT